MSKKVRVEFSGSAVELNVDDNATIRDVLQSNRVKEDPTMTYGDNRIAKQHGSILSEDTVVSDGMTITVEQQCSGKG